LDGSWANTFWLWITGIAAIQPIGETANIAAREDNRDRYLDSGRFERENGSRLV
jgi:hypothetical protein